MKSWKCLSFEQFEANKMFIWNEAMKIWGRDALKMFNLRKWSFQNVSLWFMMSQEIMFNLEEWSHENIYFAANLM